MAIQISGVQLGNLSGGPSSISLEDLSDVLVVSPQTGQYLRYNAGIAEWQNSFINSDVYGYLSTNLTASNGVSLTFLSSPETINIALDLSATGDATGTVTGTSLPLTLATVNSTPGTYGSSTTVPVITVNGKGLITSVSSTAISSTATTATNIAGGTANSIPYQSAASTTTFLAQGTGVLQESAGAPTWTLTPTLTGTNFSGIPNTALNNSSITIGSTVVNLGDNPLSLAGLTSVASTSFVGTLTGGATLDLPLAGGTMTGYLILNADPTTALGAATKQYVDNTAAGINIHPSCDTSTTSGSNLTSNTYTAGISGGGGDMGTGVGATLTSTTNVNINDSGVGGYVSLIVGSRILVQNQATNTENGIYVVTDLGVDGTSPWVLTRASDYDNITYGEVKAGDLTYIANGTLAGTLWVQTTVGTQEPGNVTNIGTDAINFSQFSSAGSYTAGPGIDISSNVISNTGVISLVNGTNISSSNSSGAWTVNVVNAPSFSGQITSTVSSGTAPFVIASPTLVTNLNANFLQGSTWASPTAIGTGTAAAGTFTALSAASLAVTNSTASTSYTTGAAIISGGVGITGAVYTNGLLSTAGTITSASTVQGTQLISTISSGTAPLTVTSNTIVPNLNSNFLQGSTWAIPGAIGSSTPNTGAFTTVSATTFTGNLVGNASTVTTNANLTGDVTSVGNVTTLSDTAVAPGTYSNPTIVVDATGRITSASNGSSAGVTSFNTRTGAVTLTSTDVTNALGYTPGSSTGTVESVSVATANGVSGSVSDPNVNPIITLTLGDITPTSIVSSGDISGANLSGTNTGDQVNITGNAATATNVSGGTANAILYQSGLGTTTFLAQGTGVLQEQAGAPTWTTSPTLVGTNFTAIPSSALINDNLSCVTATEISSNLVATVYTPGVAGEAPDTGLGVGATLTGSSDGALGTVGGYATLAIGDRVLVKNQTNAPENGIYVVTDLGSVSSVWVLTRASDYDNSTYGAVVAGDLTYVTSGDLEGTQWVQTNIGGQTGGCIRIGSDTIVFEQLGGPGLTATNLEGGLLGYLPYQSAANTTTFLAPSTNGYVLTLAAGVPSWEANTGGVTSIIGTANQVIASAPTGAVTLSLPQSINSGAAPVFSGANFTSIPNGALSNDSVTLGSTSVALGTTATTLVGFSSITSGNFTGALIGNADTASTSTNVEVSNGASAGTSCYVAFVQNSGSEPILALSTLMFNATTGNLSATEFTGSGAGLTNIPSSSITGGSITVGSTNIALGGTATSLAGLTSVGTASVAMTSAGVTTATYTSSTTTSNQIIDSVSISTIRTVKYLFQVTSGAAYQAGEILIIQDGTTPWITEFADINTGTVLATFDATISGGNLNLVFTPTNAVTTVNVVRTAISI